MACVRVLVYFWIKNVSVIGFLKEILQAMHNFFFLVTMIQIQAKQL